MHIYFLQSKTILKSRTSCFEGGSWLSLLLYNLTERKREKSSTSFKKSLVLCTFLFSGQKWEFIPHKGLARLKITSACPAFFKNFISAKAHPTPSVQKVVGGSRQRQEEQRKCPSGFPWHSEAEWKPVEYWKTRFFPSLHSRTDRILPAPARRSSHPCSLGDPLLPWDGSAQVTLLPAPPAAAWWDLEPSPDHVHQLIHS